MEPENPDQNKEVIKNSQMNSLNKGQIIEPEQNNNLMQSESQNPNINIQNKEIENNENPNINDNNSDFVSKNNYNEEMEAAGEGEENNENIEQNLENENYEENNNNRMMMNNNDPNFNMYNQNNNDMNGNENMELNNENENYQNDQQLFNDENIDESVKNYIFELQNKLNQVMNENDKLRMINQKLLAGLNDLKNRNIALNQKLNNAQIQNQRMNQEFAKLKQVKNNNMEILNLRNQIQDYEKMIYKLNNDKIILESKIGNMQIPPTNQIQNINANKVTLKKE